ncbi:ADOP family duplicated permease [Silvibacterium sp.]|uniref:ABC transporter permease n=1 Tax=Silvibacterium sp. TaxID=1964179 RepID=UPI0039E59130
MNWWQRLFKVKRMERELDSELRFHLEQQIADKVRAGMTEAEARRTTRLEFGGLAQIKEDCRESRGTMWVASFLQDLHFALRQLRNSPGYAITAILTLALGIGASTAIFEVIDAVLLRPLPYPEQERLVSPIMISRTGGTLPSSYLSYLDERAQQHTFEALAGYSVFGTLNLEGFNGPAALRAVKSTDNFFNVFGVKPILGRTYLPGEDQPGKDDVTVLSYEVWQNHFGGRSDVVGKAVQLDGTAYTIIGVMPAGFRFPMGVRNAIYTPLHLNPSWARARGMHWMRTVGRLKQGVTIEQARADLNDVMANLARAYPVQETGHTVAQLMPLSVAEISLDSFGKRTLAGPLGTLAMAVLALLAIACINIAGLLMARGIKRQREMALRSAVGATRTRLMRQLISESLVLCFAGLLGGLLIGWSLLKAMNVFLIHALSRGSDVHLNLAVVAVAAALSLLASVLASLSPAIQLSSIDPNSSLRTGSAGAGVGRSQHRLRSAFVITQVALSLVLLVISGLLMKSLEGLLHTNLGIHSSRILTTHIDLSKGHYAGRDPIETFYKPLLDRVAHLPGVLGAGVIDLLPVEAWGDGYGIHITGQPPYPSNEEMGAETRYVSTGYFNAMGLQLVDGRLLSPSLDKAENLSGTMVVNQAFQRKFFSHGGDPVGAHIDDAAKSEEKSSIVGVVTGVRQSLREPEMAEMDWLMDEIAPKDRLQSLSSMVLIVRSNRDVKALVPDLRNAMHEVDPTVPFKTPETMDEVVSESLTLDRLEGWLFGIFAAFALMLAVVGLYGLLNHEVETRTREIGVRMALGSTRVQVTRLVLGKVVLLMLSGLAIGWMLTLAFQRVLSTVVEIHAGQDLPLLAGVTACLGFVGILSTLIPVRRAASVEPVQALRTE